MPRGKWIPKQMVARTEFHPFLQDLILFKRRCPKTAHVVKVNDRFLQDNVSSLMICLACEGAVTPVYFQFLFWLRREYLPNRKSDMREKILIKIVSDQREQIFIVRWSHELLYRGTTLSLENHVSKIVFQMFFTFSSWGLFFQKAEIPKGKF